MFTQRLPDEPVPTAGWVIPQHMLATVVGNAAFIRATGTALLRENASAFHCRNPQNAIRTYRILFRDARSVLGHSHEAD
jgi:hypothetical protein